MLCQCVFHNFELRQKFRDALSFSPLSMWHIREFLLHQNLDMALKNQKHNLFRAQTNLPNLHSNLQLKRHQNHFLQQNQYIL